MSIWTLLEHAPRFQAVAVPSAAPAAASSFVTVRLVEIGLVARPDGALRAIAGMRVADDELGGGDFAVDDDARVDAAIVEACPARGDAFELAIRIAGGEVVRDLRARIAWTPGYVAVLDAALPDAHRLTIVGGRLQLDGAPVTDRDYALVRVEAFFAARMDVAVAGDLPDDVVDGAAPPPVHWNTRVLDGARPITDLVVAIGHAYTLETGLDRAPDADALASSELAPTGLPDGTAVTFTIACAHAILRDGDGGGASVDRVEHTAIYDAASGRCPPARVGLTPIAPGPITLVLGVVTGNAIRAGARVTLIAQAAATATAPPPPPPIVVAVDALTGPPAELRLELTPSGALVLSGGALLGQPVPTAKTPANLAGDAVRARQELVALAVSYRPAAGDPFAMLDAPAARLRMAQIGARLHEAFFSHPDEVGDLDLKQLARTIAATPRPGEVARLQIGAAYQPFPWAVLYDGAYRGAPLTDDPASVDPACFWGHRLRIDRAIVGHASPPRAPARRGPIRVQACINPTLDNAAHGIDVVRGQRELFDGLDGVTAAPRIESADGFRRYLAQQPGPCDLLYVLCHANAAETLDGMFTFTSSAPDTQARLIFDGTGPVDVAAMRALRRAALADQPLVFLNACSSAAGDQAFQSPLLEQFLERWQVGGVLGTDWEVPVIFADAFARRVVHHFLRARLSLGEAFARAGDDAFAAGNPFALVYALYARPDLITVPAPPAPGALQ